MTTYCNSHPEDTLLKKADNFRYAYSQFDIDTVTSFGEEERARLLSDVGIIRNRLKVNAAIENARRIQGLRGEYRSFKGWLDRHHPQPLENWIKLFKGNFNFYRWGDRQRILNEHGLSTQRSYAGFPHS